MLRLLVETRVHASTRVDDGKQDPIWLASKAFFGRLFARYDYTAQLLLLLV